MLHSDNDFSLPNCIIFKTLFLSVKMSRHDLLHTVTLFEVVPLFQTGLVAGRALSVRYRLQVSQGCGPPAACHEMTLN